MSVQASQKKTWWFLESRNGPTNESATTELAAMCGATDDKVHRGRKDVNGKPHKVVEVTHAFIADMERNIPNFHFKFRVFVQKEGTDAMKEWTFGNKSNLQRTAKIKRTKTQIAGLKKRKS